MSEPEDWPALLGRLGERVVVLHTPPAADDDADLSGGDVDCAVAGLDHSWPLDLGEGWRLCQVLHYDLRGWCWIVERAGTVVALDTLDDPRGLGRDSVPTAPLLAGANGERVVDAPPWLTAAYLTAKRVRKGEHRGAEWNRIGRLAATDPARFRDLTGQLLGVRAARVVVDDAVAGRSPGRRALRRARLLQTAQRYRGPSAIPSAVVLGARRRVERLLHPTGMTVVITGPDGAGKSALAATLPEACAGLFRRFAHQHWRPGLLPRPGAVAGRESADPSAPHGRPAHGALLSTVLVAYYWLDFALGSALRTVPARARTGLVVVERGWWDLLVDPARYRLRPRPRLVTALGRLLPRTDLTVVLDAPSETLAARKNELSHDELGRQREAWHEVATRMPQSTLIVDAARPAAEVATTVRAAIVEHLERRTRGRLGPGYVALPRRGSPRWLVPRRPRRATSSGLQVYRPVTRRARAGWTALRAGAAVGALGLAPRGPAPDPRVRDAVAAWVPVGGSVAIAAVRGGDRFVAVLLDSGGRPVSVAKVATSAGAARSLAREGDNLETLAPRLPAPLHAPRLLERGERALLLEFITSTGTRRPERLDREVAEALGRFSRSGRSLVAHGDSAPWNLLRTRTGWALIDWEDAHSDAEPFEDLCHWLVQSHVLLRRPSLETVVRAVTTAEGPFGDAVKAFALGADLDVALLPDAMVGHLDGLDARLDDDPQHATRARDARRSLREALRS